MTASSPRGVPPLLRLILRLYPQDFRDEFGDEWVDVSADRLARMREAGLRWPSLRLAAFLLRDALMGLPAAYANERSLSETSGNSPILRHSGDRSMTAFIDSVLRDIRFGVRSLLRRPLFAVVAVGTLGLGIGALYPNSRRHFGKGRLTFSKGGMDGDASAGIGRAAAVYSTV